MALWEQAIGRGVYLNVKFQQQLLALAAAPLSSLFLLLAILPAVFPHKSHGVDLWLPQPAASREQAFEECGDDRLIYLRLPADAAPKSMRHP